MSTDFQHNQSFSTAAAFINNSRQAVFLTGKAGTGKTTFLKYIKENTPKNCAIVAPTGVAAINAGGTTIHSFFQLPFSPFLPFGSRPGNNENSVDKHSLFSKIKLSNERKEVMQQLELLIIDEISMVRADVLDAMDTILRQVRSRYQSPFGGVQVLYIGDMYQLPPVVKEEEWTMLREFYENPFFFSSQVVKEQNPVYIELQHVYRQSDIEFIELLNKVRNNEMDEAGYELLSTRFKKKAAKENIITLTTHNYKADSINNEEMDKLPAKQFIFNAAVEGDFPERMYPIDAALRLKEGAQVMFIKNDTEKVRRYFNGKIGIVTKIDAENIVVTIDNDGSKTAIEVKKDIWKNVKYTVDKGKQHIEEDVLGTFTHYPLRLAWAITIHKSQGLTFDYAVIDAEKAFAPGQVYVALSRCRTLDGIVLNSAIPLQSLRSDPRIVAFSKQQVSAGEQENILQQAIQNYQQEILFELVDFTGMEKDAEKLKDFIVQNNAFGIKSIEWAKSVCVSIELFAKHGKKFSTQLQALFTPGLLPENNNPLKDRFSKAAGWFKEQLQGPKTQLQKVPAVTDNRQLAMDFSTRAGKLFDAIAERIYLLENCVAGFNGAAYQQHKAAYKKEKYPVNIYSGTGTYGENTSKHNLLNQLREKRNELAAQQNTALYMICSSGSLEQMAAYFPQTEKELEQIKGLGKSRIKQYGKEFLAIIVAYCEFFGIETNMHNLETNPSKKKKAPAVKKPDTKLLTFDLFQQGKTPEQIATERNLTIGTIESHLEHFVKNGSLAIDKLLSLETRLEIAAVLDEEGISGYAQVKEKLPQFSYGQIRWVAAAREKENSPVN
ncbi:MAG: helix-turn-helix domain-containing protein [Ferruginibacter sp.]